MNKLVDEIDRARGQVLVRVLVGFVVALVAPWLTPLVWLTAIAPAVRWVRASWRLGGELDRRRRIPAVDLRALPSGPQ